MSLRTNNLIADQYKAPAVVCEASLLELHRSRLDCGKPGRRRTVNCTG